MPGGYGMVIAGSLGSKLGNKAGAWLAKRFTKKAARKIIVAGAGTVALDRAVGGWGGKGEDPFKWPGGKLSPFEPGRGVFGRSGGRGRVQAGEMGACPPGYHLNKAALTDGTPPRSVCVRNRSVNYANGRAARRAGRRLRGTVKMLKRSFTMVSGSAPKGKFIPRKK